MTGFRVNHLSIKCPFCDNAATFDTMTEFAYTYYRYYLTMRCPNCDKIVFVLYDTDSKKIMEIYPESVPTCDQRIPKKIADDFLEAKRCFGAGAYKGTVVMCRRALQNTTIHKGAKKKDLFDQLNELVTKGIIPEGLEKLAHSIRSMGNYGAHPDKDGLDKVIKEDAEEMLNFLDHFLNYVFVMPKRVEELESKSKKKKV